MAQKIENETTTTVYDKWDDFELKDELHRGIVACGYDTPSFIQKTAIMPIITGRDVRAQAQSGTGKTAAFGIGSLQRITDKKETQVLIMVSTREIAEQNAQRIRILSQFMDIRIHVLSGGTNIQDSIEELRKGPQIVTGTPGRILHMIEKGYLDTSKLKLLVIDEADEMLNAGFKDQVNNIFMYLPEEMQIAMFSATWEEEEIQLANCILQNPVVIDLRQDEQTLKGIDQYFVYLGKKPEKGADMRKIDALVDIFKNNELEQCIVFVNTRLKAKFMHSTLNNKKIPADVMHADLTQKERVEVLERFRQGSCRLLIATGLIGRGIDIQHLSLVFNCDIPRPQEKAVYIHRIGRAGRFGKKGKAINFVYDEDMDDLKAIECHYQTKIYPMPKNLNLK